MHVSVASAGRVGAADGSEADSWLVRDARVPTVSLVQMVQIGRRSQGSK